MTAKLLALSVLAGTMLGASAAKADLIVTQNADASTLAGVFLGSGITIDSASVTGASSAFGTFTGGNSVGGGFFESGIVMSSGQVTDAPGPNNSDGTSTSFGTAGDSALDALIPQSTNDAAIFEINLTSTGGDLFFRYIFASEEYNEYVGSQYNDIFAFFLDGENIALIPGTDDPVSINTVNATTNSAFFRNNDPSDTTTPFNIEYDGFTSVLTAAATGLAPGQHTLRLAIADAGDSILDSAIFLQAGTLSDDPGLSIPEPDSLALLLGGLVAGGILRRRRARA